jgi:hypothetical protein
MNEPMEQQNLPGDRMALQRDFLPRMGAGCLILVGVAISAIAIAATISTGQIDFTGAVFYALVGAGFGISGVFWLRYIGTMESARRIHFAEKMVLRAAYRNSGGLTVAMITLGTPLTVAEAEAALERLCIRGIATPEIREDGTIEYRFNGLLPG